MLAHVFKRHNAFKLLRYFYLSLAVHGQANFCLPVGRLCSPIILSFNIKRLYLYFFIVSFYYKLRVIIKVFVFLPDAASEGDGGYCAEL